MIDWEWEEEAAVFIFWLNLKCQRCKCRMSRPSTTPVSEAVQRHVEDCCVRANDELEARLEAFDLGREEDESDPN